MENSGLIHFKIKKINITSAQLSKSEEGMIKNNLRENINRLKKVQKCILS